MERALALPSVKRVRAAHEARGEGEMCAPPTFPPPPRDPLTLLANPALPLPLSLSPSLTPSLSLSLSLPLSLSLCLCLWTFLAGRIHIL